jgi:hypothetical protein
MQRASDDRLRTFDTHVTDLLTESGGRGTWSVQHELIAGTVETVEPHREALRSWLMAVRLLDAPREDIYLPDVLDLLEAMPIRDSTREMVGAIRQQWQDAQTTLAFIASRTPRVRSRRATRSSYLHTFTISTGTR